MYVLMREWTDDDGRECEEVLLTGDKPLLDLVAGVLNAKPGTTGFYTYVTRAVTEVTFQDVLNLEDFLKREGFKI